MHPTAAVEYYYVISRVIFPRALYVVSFDLRNAKFHFKFKTRAFSERHKPSKKIFCLLMNLSTNERVFQILISKCMKL